MEREGPIAVPSKTILPSRRSFLKASSLATLAAAIPGEANAKPSSGESQDHPNSAKSTRNPADLVNLLQGTDSNPEFSRGNTLPIAALPFGMAHWTLQSRARTPWMFNPNDRRIQGLRSTHQFSPWMGDYGQATFMPFCGDPHPDAAGRASSYLADSAKLTPYSLQLFLLRYRAHVELVPTERCAVLTARFEADQAAKTPGLIFEVPGDNKIEADAQRRQIRFTSTANSGGVPKNFATYYVLEFPETWTSFNVKPIESAGKTTSQNGIVSFQPGQSIKVNIGTSFISFDQAERNLQREVGSNSVDALRQAAATRWNEHLLRIEIEGASETQQRIFYSCLYRTLLFPRVWHEYDAAGAMQHFSCFNGQVSPGPMYADHVYWDMYRVWYPMMTLLFPERLGEILAAWVNIYREGGWMPQCPGPGYRDIMTGTLMDSVIGDAAIKKIPGFDLQTAYEGIRKNATQAGDPEKGYGRVNFDEYARLNYIPADNTETSVAQAVDFAYGDYCIAQVAKLLGKQDDAEFFLKRSSSWQHIFDTETKFFRGKRADGSWLTPFDPATWGNPYVEGAAWQYRFHAPHDIPKLIELMGGPAQAAALLEEMLTVPAAFNVGMYGFEIHEMSEMAAVPFGQYAHSNQPVHHILYFFAHAGRADRTQHWVRRVLNELYTVDKFPGDEDTGSMAAWYVMSALGLYQVCPGQPEYTLGSPLFRRATLHLPGKRTLIVEAPGNSPEKSQVKSVTLNQQPKTATVTHQELIQGGTLRFEMA